MGRDPARIPRMLGIVADIWARAPDLRLAQLLLNAAYLTTSNKDLSTVFYMEDDELEEALLELRAVAERAAEPPE